MQLKLFLKSFAGWQHPGYHIIHEVQVASLSVPLDLFFVVTLLSPSSDKVQISISGWHQKTYNDD